MEILRRIGFAPHPKAVPHGGKYLVRLLTENDDPGSWQLHGRSFLDAENWDLRMIMSDAY
jgi:hypothetical protein